MGAETVGPAERWLLATQQGGPQALGHVCLVGFPAIGAGRFSQDLAGVRQTHTQRKRWAHYPAPLAISGLRSEFGVPQNIDGRDSYRRWAIFSHLIQRAEPGQHDPIIIF